MIIGEKHGCLLNTALHRFGGDGIGNAPNLVDFALNGITHLLDSVSLHGADINGRNIRKISKNIMGEGGRGGGSK
jgi:hypothetical protein